MLGMVSGLRERHPSLVIVAAVPTPDCTTTVALLDAGVDEIVDTTGDIALATARIMAAARRRLRLTMPMLSEVGNLKFDRTNHRVWNADRQLRLSPLEYAFLDCLISAHGKSVGTRTLSDFVWTSNGRSPRSKNAVQVYVGYLRRKLSIAQVSIQNVRGKGYRLVAESAPPTRSAS
jgi:DNA-binding response OmpR family regulator